MSTTVTHAGRPRLNPLPFPSDTTLRFALLAIFVLCVSSQLYAQFWDTFHVAGMSAARTCTSTVTDKIMHANARGDADALAAQMRDTLGPQLLACAMLLRPQAWWALYGIALTVAVGMLIYLAYPAVKLRTGRLVPIDPIYPSGLHDALVELCGTAGLAAVPRFVWNPLSTGHPVAFGRHGKYYVTLTGGFVSNYFVADPVSFRAIVLHELAHIRSGDIEKTYITISACLAFVCTSLVPSVVILLSRSLGWHDGVPLAFRTLLWGSLVLLSGLSVLRVREFYADVRASQWDGTVRNVDRALDRMSGAVHGRLRAWLSPHPPGDERRRVLADTSRLFPLDSVTAFGIGCVAGLVVEMVDDVLIGFLPRLSSVSWMWTTGKVVTPAIVMILAIGALGICTWRGAYAALLTGRRPSRGLAWVGAAFALGYSANSALIAIDYAWDLISKPEIALPSGALQFRSDALFAVVLMFECWLAMGWIARCAAAWTEVVLTSESPRTVLRVTIAVLLAMILILFAWGSFSTSFMTMLGPMISTSDNSFFVYLELAAPPLLLMATVAWMFPYISRGFVRARRDRGVSAWVFLDGHVDHRPAFEAFEAFAPGRAVIAGLFAGLAYCLLVELVRFGSVFPAPIAAAIASAFSFLDAPAKRAGNAGYLLVAGSALASAIAAAVCAWRHSPFNALYGLCAGSISGTVIGLGTVALLGSLDGQSVWAVTLVVFSYITVSTFSAFVVSMICAGMVDLRYAWFRAHSTIRPSPARTGGTRRKGSLARMCGLALMLVVIVAGSVKHPAQKPEAVAAPVGEWANYVNGGLVKGSSTSTSMDDRCLLRIIIERRIVFFRPPTDRDNKAGTYSNDAHVRWARNDNGSCRQSDYAPDGKSEMSRTWSLIPAADSSVLKYKAKFEKCDLSPNCTVAGIDRSDFEPVFYTRGIDIIMPDDPEFDATFIPIDDLRSRSNVIVRSFVDKLRLSRFPGAQRLVSDSADSQVVESLRRYYTERLLTSQGYEIDEAYLMSARDAPDRTPQIVHATIREKTPGGEGVLETIELSGSNDGWKLVSFWLHGTKDH